MYRNLHAFSTLSPLPPSFLPPSSLLPLSYNTLWHPYNPDVQPASMFDPPRCSTRHGAPPGSLYFCLSPTYTFLSKKRQLARDSGTPACKVPCGLGLLRGLSLLCRECIGWREGNGVEGPGSLLSLLYRECIGWGEGKISREGGGLERLSPAGRPAGRRRTPPRARDSDNSSSCNDYNDNSSGSNSAAGWWIVVMASGRHDLFFSCARARARV